MNAFCIGNTARPLLSVGPKDVRGGRKTYLFVEALKKYQDEARVMDLVESYKKALPMYKGRLEHTFVVLKDKENDAQPTSGSNNEPLGNKRPAEPEEQEVSQKRMAL